MVVLKFLARALLVLFFASTLYGADKTLTIKKVNVRQKGENSVEAKEKALFKASRLSFAKILKDHFGLDKKVADSMTSQQISECISGYSVQHEKQSDSYYIAELSYKFDRESIENLLTTQGLLQRSSDVSKGGKNGKKSNDIVLLLSLNDFMGNIHQLKHTKYKVHKFSNAVVELSMGILYLNDIKTLGITYVVI
ncbi:MAG: hypothetical protein LBB29_01720 [Holosporaceae bacterium]|jgi:hypothetical protein|nr:hypothetical protein [Holosporaceae bacterium]